MRSFIWRLRSNAFYFSATLAIFTAVYLIIEYNGISFGNGNSHLVYCLKYADPTIISVCFSFVFFFICQKRYAFDEDYIYGTSRRSAFLSSVSCSAIYSFLFACYAMGLALLVRRDILSMDRLAVSATLYNLSASEIFLNFSFLFVINMIGYEAASILRKFRSWKFWLTLAVCVTSVILLYYFVVYAPQHDGMYVIRINYWKATFTAFLPQLVIMTGLDFFMTRGRQYR